MVKIKYKNIGYKYFIVFFCFFQILASFGQTNDSLEDNIITTKKYVFLYNNSFNPLTFFFEPNGNFYFRNKHIESLYSDNKSAITIKLDKKGNITKRYRDIFVSTLNNSIDTLKNYFPESIIKNDSLYLITQSINFSFILQQLNEPILNNSPENQVLRLLYTEDDVRNCIKNFNSIRIHFYNNSAMLFYTKGCYDEYFNIKITYKDSCYLKEKKINIIEKHLNKIDYSKENIFCRTDMPWLFEYKDGIKHHIFLRSYYCQDSYETLPLFLKLFNVIQGYTKNRYCKK